jgi:hypothetical protein
MENENKITETASKKSNNKFIILAIIILILGMVLILNNKSSKDNSDFGNSIKSRNGEELVDKYQTKTDEQASVTVDITPKKLGLAEEKNIFEVSLNTHSVDLSYDFQKIIIREDDLGNIYQALEWTGGEGGHHLVGEIIFPKLNLSAKKVKLTINGVGGAERVFEWML